MTQILSKYKYYFIFISYSRSNINDNRTKEQCKFISPNTTNYYLNIIVTLFEKSKMKYMYILFFNLYPISQMMTIDNITIEQSIVS